MKVRLTRFIFVVIRQPDGITEREFPILADSLGKAKPDRWQLLQPEHVIAYFVDRRGAAARADWLEQRARELRAFDPLFSRCRVARHVGLAVAQFDWLGRMRSSAAGDQANVAMRLVSDGPAPAAS